MRWIITLALTGLSALLLGSISANAESRQYTPATLTERRIAYGQGSVASVSERIVAMRPDGSHATLAMYEPSMKNIRTIETANGSRTTIIDDLRVLSTVQMPENDIEHAARIRTASHCILGSASLLRTETLHGVNVYVIQYYIPLKMLRATEWRAPDYGCFALRSTLEEAKQDGPYSLIAENVVTDLQNGDSDSRLFDIPAGYEKVTGSELNAMVH
jgi:hypothetical protein